LSRGDCRLKFESGVIKPKWRLNTLRAWISTPSWAGWIARTLAHDLRILDRTEAATDFIGMGLGELSKGGGLRGQRLVREHATAFGLLILGASAHLPRPFRLR
jgi:hypothetical protein